MQGAIVQVNISPGGLPKRAITEGWITPLGIEGDLHAHPEIHGGPLKAILIVASEVVDALAARGYPLFYGAMGENLTTRGWVISIRAPPARIWSPMRIWAISMPRVVRFSPMAP